MLKGVVIYLLILLYKVKKCWSRVSLLSDKAYYSRRFSINTGFISGRDVSIIGGGVLKVGLNSYIGNFSSVQISKGCSVILGENVSLSHNVRIYTSGRKPEGVISGESLGYRYGNVIIGNNVWVGANVMILHGVNIANNVVVGANSVVVKSLLEPGVYVGAPARKINSNG